MAQHVQVQLINLMQSCLYLTVILGFKQYFSLYGKRVFFKFYKYIYFRIDILKNMRNVCHSMRNYKTSLYSKFLCVLHIISCWCYLMLVSPNSLMNKNNFILSYYYILTLWQGMSPTPWKTVCGTLKTIWGTWETI